MKRSRIGPYRYHLLSASRSMRRCPPLRLVKPIPHQRSVFISEAASLAVRRLHQRSAFIHNKTPSVPSPFLPLVPDPTGSSRSRRFPPAASAFRPRDHTRGRQEHAGINTTTTERKWRARHIPRLLYTLQNRFFAAELAQNDKICGGQSAMIIEAGS